MEKTTDRNDYNFAFLDEGSKREIRRSILHAIAIPGYQVPFGSRELPIGRGWGTGGIQLTMSLIGPHDTLKVIDQGNDDNQPATSSEAFLSLYEDGKTNFLEVSSQQKRYLRNHLMGMVYQNPMLGLRMKLSSGANVAEKLIAAGNRNADSMIERCKELLQHVEIPTERLKEQPRVFSGGMQQRVQISKAIANNPPILLLDEVTTGLDLSVQAKVLDLIRSIQKELGIAMMVVSHDLAVIRMMSDRTMVMLGGRVVEEGLTDQILEDPLHAYTQTLVSSLL